MERVNSRNKKRTRDGGDDKKDSHRGKKQKNVIIRHDCFDSDQTQHEFYDGSGVFDFPWLKEGVTFITDEYLEPEEKFEPFCEAPGTPADNFDLQNSILSPALDQDVYNFYDKKLDDDRCWSLDVDDFESIDCICSCVIDQPLDISMNKR
ncbi:hypothetical protein OROHE_014595 [Orobanche hederae]